MSEWSWRNGSGRFKDMATRTLLVKPDARGLIELPTRRRPPSNRMASRRVSLQNWDSTAVTGALNEVGPLMVREVSTDSRARIRFAAALAEFHYLGYRGTVGENLQYIVTTESGRLVAYCLGPLPGSASRAPVSSAEARNRDSGICTWSQTTPAS